MIRLRHRTEGKRIAVDLSTAKKAKRFRDLQAFAQSWLPLGGWQSLVWYEYLEDYKLLPFSGGVAEQPTWWLDDVEGFRLLQEWFMMASSLPKVDDFPSIDEV